MCPFPGTLTANPCQAVERATGTSGADGESIRSGATGLTVMVILAFDLRDMVLGPFVDNLRVSGITQ